MKKLIIVLSIFLLFGLVGCTQQESQYHIYFDTDGGSEVKPILTDGTETLNLSYDSIKDGYTFIGWYDNAQLTGLAVTNIEPGITKDITLYAGWKVNQYNITYNIYDDYDSVNSILLNNGDKVIDVVTEGAHSGAITLTGRVFMWGSNSFGRLGDGTKLDKHSPTEITSQFNLYKGEKVIKISLGCSHTGAITSMGRVFMWGCNNHGQLGDNTTSEKSTPIEITSQFNLSDGETVIDVFLGYFHSSAITSMGRVFTWGENYHGQLGDNTTLSKSIPTDITSQFELYDGEIITNLSLRWYSSAITSMGRVFIWGGTYATRLELEEPIDITSQFNLHEEEKVINIAYGYNDFLVNTSEGRVLYTSVYTFYTNYTDLSILTNDITSLFDLYEGEKVINIFYSSEHSAVITSMGRVFTWGKNSHGQLGNGTETEEVYPIEITSQFNLLEGESVDNISFASDTNTGAITSMGRVFMWGGNSHGELGDGTILNKSIPVLLPFVSAISTTIESIYYGEPITEYIPIKEGYTFDGWYDDIENNESYVFSRFYYISRMVSTHIYIYATRNDIVYMFGTIPYVFKECYDGESDPTLYLFKTMPAKDIMVVGTWNADE